jgi:hypothetical protein
MGPHLLDSIANRLCSHQFSWPRRRPDGDYYQVCVLCGSEYSYDWATMTRTGRIDSASSTEAGAQPASPVRRRANWVPRARRLKVDLGLKYRQTGTEDWSEGKVVNISQTGLLFEAALALRHDADVELVLIMPEEITGQPNSRVLCQGYIVRSGSSKGSARLLTLAAAISGYAFLAADE